MLEKAKSKASELAGLAGQTARSVREGPVAARLEQRILAIATALQTLPHSEATTVDSLNPSLHEEIRLLEYCEAAYDPALPKPFELIADGRAHNVRCCLLYTSPSPRD